MLAGLLFIIIIEGIKHGMRGDVMKTFVETSSILLEEIDGMIQAGYFNDRTEAVNQAIKEMLDRYKLSKLRMKESELYSGKTNGQSEA